MGAQHTPGPWHVVGRQDGALPHSRVGAKTLLARVYSEAYGDVAQEDANARLIAAAPDLLAALRGAAEGLEGLAADARLTHPDGAMAAVRFAASARAAIAKADGRS